MSEGKAASYKQAGVYLEVAEALVDMGMKTSKVLSYQRPEKKEFKGMAELFQP